MKNLLLFLLERARLSLTRRKQLSALLFLGIMLSFTLIVGLSTSSQKYYNETVTTFDHLGEGLVLVEKGTPFVQGLPIQSTVRFDILDSLANDTTIASWFDMTWTANREENSILGDILLGVGRGSFEVPQYQRATGLSLAEGDLPEDNTYEMLIGQDTSSYRHGSRVGSTWEVRDQEMKVTGIIDTDRVTQARYYITSHQTFMNLTSIDTFVNMVFVKPSEGISLEELESELEGKFITIDALNRQERDALLSNVLNSIERFSNYITYMSAIIALIYTLVFSRLIIQLRRREFGILLSMGARPTDLYIQFGSEISIIGIIAACTGSFIGIMSSSIFLFEHIKFSVSVEEYVASVWELTIQTPWLLPLFLLISLIGVSLVSMLSYFSNLSTLDLLKIE